MCRLKLMNNIRKGYITEIVFWQVPVLMLTVAAAWIQKRNSPETLGLCGVTGGHWLLSCSLSPLRVLLRNLTPTERWTCRKPGECSHQHNELVMWKMTRVTGEKGLDMLTSSSVLVTWCGSKKPHLMCHVLLTSLRPNSLSLQSPLYISVMVSFTLDGEGSRCHFLSSVSNRAVDWF